MDFKSLGLCSWIQNTCNVLKIYRPTKIQSRTIPLILNGRNVLGNAPTGSGKTLCYCLPMLQILSEDPFSIFGLVLLPSRELSYQVLDQFQVFGNKINSICQVLTGGFDESEQIHILNQKRPHIIIATPGRMSSIICYPGGNVLDMVKNLRFLVLDEADKLLSESLEDDMFPILSAIPKSKTGRQTLLFSATLSRAIKEVVNRNFEMIGNQTDKLKPQELPIIIIDENPNDLPLESVRQMYLFTNHRIRLVYLHYVLKNTQFFNIASVNNKKLENSIFFDDSQEEIEDVSLSHKKVVDSKEKQVINEGNLIKQGIIFTATKQQCQLLTSFLEIMGYSVTGLHSLMSQRRRLASLGKFRSKASQLLVATGVATRGLDIPDIEFVINFDFPRSFEDYIHRIGRVGRAGKLGISLSFITKEDIPYVHEIEGRMKKQMELLKLDENDVLKQMNKVTLAQQRAILLLDEIGFNDKNKEARKKKLKALNLKRSLKSTKSEIKNN